MTKQKNKRKNDRLEGIFQHDEGILWQGRPNLNKHFRIEDLFLIPASLLPSMMGISIFRLPFTSDAPMITAIWGIPFALWGAYMMFGRFIHNYLRKRKTHYFVTDGRVIAVNEFLGFRVKSYTIRALNELSLNGSTVIFSLRKNPYTGGQGNANWSKADDDGFHDIDDARDVYELIVSLRGDIKVKKKNDKRKTQAQE